MLVTHKSKKFKELTCLSSQKVMISSSFFSKVIHIFLLVMMHWNGCCSRASSAVKKYVHRLLSDEQNVKWFPCLHSLM